MAHQQSVGKLVTFNYSKVKETKKIPISASDLRSLSKQTVIDAILT